MTNNMAVTKILYRFLTAGGHYDKSFERIEGGMPAFNRRPNDMVCRWGQHGIIESFVPFF